jgi:hypothetical protein
LCRDGRLYEVERWVAAAKPLQLAPEAIRKGTRPKTALQIALETGQHSLAALLLSHGYRLELERYAPLDLTLRNRRWDLFELLLGWGADLKTVKVSTVLDTYNTELYERFRAAGYDLTAGHEMGATLGLGTRNRPLLGFVKRHRTEDPKIQMELNIALGYHVRAGNERGVNLCLWARADPHAPAPNLALGVPEDREPEGGEEPFIGWSAFEEAAREGNLDLLKRLGPDPALDDFDELYKHAKYAAVIAFLVAIQPPKDLTSILWWHLWWMVDRLPWFPRTGSGTVEALLTCGVRWQEADPERLTEIRRLLLKADDYDLKNVLRHLKRAEVCTPETYEELIRTPKIRQRLLALGFLKKPVSEREKRARRREELSRLGDRYDRAALYEQVWSQPVRDVARSYGISGVALGKVCRKLQVPVPPRGYWARVRNGYTVRKPGLPGLDERSVRLWSPRCDGSRVQERPETRVSRSRSLGENLVGVMYRGSVPGLKTAEPARLTP